MLTIKTRAEGESFPDSFLSFGRLYETGRGFNGFYVRVRSPFTSTGTWTNPNNFENVEHVQLRSALTMRWRKLYGDGPWFFRAFKYQDRV